MNKTMLALLLAAPSLAMAQTSGVTDTGLQYNNIGIQYINTDFDDIDMDADGIGVAASALLTDTVFIAGNLSVMETDDFYLTDGASLYSGSIEQTQFGLALGARSPVSPNADVYGAAGLIRSEVEGTGDLRALDDSDTGLMLQAGLRAMVSPAVEVSGTLTYVDIFDDSNTAFGIAGAFYVAPQIALTAGFSVSSDEDSFTLGARYSY